MGRRTHTRSRCTIRVLQPRNLFREGRTIPSPPQLHRGRVVMSQSHDDASRAQSLFLTLQPPFNANLHNPRPFYKPLLFFWGDILRFIKAPFLKENWWVSVTGSCCRDRQIKKLFLWESKFARYQLQNTPTGLKVGLRRHVGSHNLFKLHVTTEILSVLCATC